MVLVDSVGYDLGKYKEPQEYKKPTLIVRFLKNLGLILFFSFIVFFTVNFPAYAAITGYKVNPIKFKKEAPQIENALIVPREGRTTAATSNATKTPVPTKEIKQYPDSTLFIPKIGIEAPINWDTGENGIMNTLERGLAHIAGTGKPGDGKNVYVTGHSSNYWWKVGDYNTIFALLPEMNNGDEIFITYKGKFYKYKVSDIKEVNPKEVENYIETKDEQLTLMTCVPVGTNLRRLLIFAKPA